MENMKIVTYSECNAVQLQWSSQIWNHNCGKFPLELQTTNCNMYLIPYTILITLKILLRIIPKSWNFEKKFCLNFEKHFLETEFYLTARLSISNLFVEELPSIEKRFMFVCICIRLQITKWLVRARKCK